MSELGNYAAINGDALNLQLPDESVDLIVTSPPYFALRSYTDGGEHYAGQVGDEATPAEYIAALVKATEEMKRVLTPTGSIWVNLGDKYAGGGNGPQGISVSPRSAGIGTTVIVQSSRHDSRSIRLVAAFP